MAHQVADEFGVQWLVDTGDPANDAVNYLKRRGFRTYVLPRRTLLYRAAEAVVGFTPFDVLTAARLLDCVGVLNDRT